MADSGVGPAATNRHRISAEYFLHDPYDVQRPAKGELLVQVEKSDVFQLPLVSAEQEKLAPFYA
jgi:hypothetical protein